MCDYSLACFPNRLAVEGEQLVVHRFPTGALGLASPYRGLKQIFSPSSRPAVCIPPGARLLLRDIPQQLQWRLGVQEVEEVTFVEQSAEAFSYRDAVRFADGREILLQHLRCGQRIAVLSLSGVAEEIEHQRREEEYQRLFAAEAGRASLDQRLSLTASSALPLDRKRCEAEALRRWNQDGCYTEGQGCSKEAR